MKRVARYTAIAYFLVLAFMMNGCIGNSLSLFEPGDTLPAGQSIDKLINAWSRHSQVHKRWATVLDANAVFLSWELRSAIAEQTIQAKNIQEPTASAIRERVSDLHQGYVTFYLAVFTTMPEWNNLDSEDTVWTITFNSDRIEGVSSFRVELAEMEPAMQYALFKDHTNWQKLYRVSFLRRIGDSGQLLIDNDTSWFGLRFDSYLGSSEMTWRLKSGHHKAS